MKLRTIFLPILLAALFLTLTPISYASNYGEGSYGSGLYGKGGPAPTSNPGNSGSNNSNGGGGNGNNDTAQSCTDHAPTASPDLFQADAKNNTVKLYFSPAGSNISSYYLSFGLGNLDEGHGAPLSIDSRGVASYDVTYLSPNTTYTFKVRGANGCTAGPWSKTMRVKTTNSAKSIIKYYPQKQAASSIRNTIAGLQKYVSAKIAPQEKLQVTPTIQKAVQKQQQGAPRSQPIKQTAQQSSLPPQPSLFEKVLNFFGF